jgi:hypothetical protein
VTWSRCRAEVKVDILGWRRGSSGRALPTKHEALSSNPIPLKKKKKLYLPSCLFTVTHRVTGENQLSLNYFGWGSGSGGVAYDKASANQRTPLLRP